MTTKTYFLDENQSSRLEISWKGYFFDIFKKDFVIRLNDQVIDTIQKQTELEKSKVYPLAERSILKIQLDPNNLEVFHNENKLQAYRDPVESLKTSYSLTNLLGGFLVIIGLLNILPLTNEGAGQEYIFWEGYLSLVFGLLVLVASYVSKRVATASSLKIIVMIVILQMIILDIFAPIIIENSFLDLKGLLVTILILGPIFKSIRTLQISLEHE